MKSRLIARLLLPVLGAAGITMLPAQETPPPPAVKNPIPEDVVGDEHVRENSA